MTRRRRSGARGPSVALLIAALLLSPLVAAPLAQADEPEGSGTPEREEPPAAEPATEPDAIDDAMLEEELQMLDAQVYEDEAEARPTEGEDGAPAEPKAKPDAAQPMPELREVTVRYTPEDIFRMGGSVQALDQEQLEKKDTVEEKMEL